MKDFLKKLKLAEGTISMLLGAAVVIVVGVLLFNFFRGKPTIPTVKEEVTTKETVPPSTPTPPASLPATYKVEKGDHLWKIAIKFYGSGYNWVDIVKENQLKNPDVIRNGQELRIPEVAVRTATITLPKTGKGETAGEAITGGNYAVVRGDNLWKISVRAYQDGFKWTEIAKVNKLVNPNLIHPGNILELPR
jgi:nucleoid-associated protein YgaU